MSDGSLSQDEIDALLQGSGGMDFDEAPPAAVQEVTFSAQDRKAFQRFMSESIEMQSSTLSTLMSDKTVSISKPTVDVVDSSTLEEDLEDQMVQITLDLNSGIVGNHSYILPESGALQIAGAMMGQEDTEIDDAALNALQEAFSQVSGPLLTSIGDRIDATVMSEAPTANFGPRDSLSLPTGEFVKVVFPVSIEGGSSFELTEIFEMSAASEILTQAGLRTETAPRPATRPQPQAQRAQPAPQFGGQAQFGAPQGGYGAAPQQGYGAQVQSVQFPNLQPNNMQQEQGNISLLMDVYMEMTVELGRTKKLIKEILGMGEGTIIELDKLAGEPVDILVNHKLIAKGEVVVIDENFGVRVTEIVSTMERLNNMT